MQASKMRKPAFWVVMAGFVLFSCRKENISSHPVSADSTVVFSATIGNDNWHTDSVSAFLVDDYREHCKIMTITGYTANKLITINLKDTSVNTLNDSTMATGQYKVDQWGSTAAFAYASNWILVGRDSIWQKQGVALTGQANVTSSDGVNRKVSGNFNFTAKLITLTTTGFGIDSVVVTNGVFKNIPYTFFRHR